MGDAFFSVTDAQSLRAAEMEKWKEWGVWVQDRLDDFIWDYAVRAHGRPPKNKREAMRMLEKHMKPAVDEMNRVGFWSVLDGLDPHPKKE